MYEMSLPYESGPYKSVSMNQYVVGEDQSNLFTGGVATCLGIAVYDRRAQLASMAHIMPETDTRSTIDAYFNELERMHGDPNDQYVWVRGNSFHTDYPADQQRSVNNLAYLAKCLARYGCSTNAINIEQGRRDDVYNLQLEPTTGLCQIETWSLRSAYQPTTVCYSS